MRQPKLFSIVFVILFLISFAFSRDEHAFCAVKWIQGKVRSVLELITVLLFQKKKQNTKNYVCAEK